MSTEDNYYFENPRYDEDPAWSDDDDFLDQDLPEHEPLFQVVKIKYAKSYSPISLEKLAVNTIKQRLKGKSAKSLPIPEEFKRVFLSIDQKILSVK